MKHYYHPVCHLINGKRLYFVFISVSTSISRAEETIGRVIKNRDDSSESTLQSECQCSYTLIGAKDVLIKLWCEEDSILGLIRKLESERTITSVSSYLISYSNTWYERQIEADARSRSLMEESDISEILDPDNSHFEQLSFKLRHDEEVNHAAVVGKSIDRPFKFWVVIQHDYAISNSRLRQVEEEVIQLGGSPSKIEKVSVYKFETSQNKGVIVKADSYNLLDGIAEVLEVIQNQYENERYTTTTYLAKTRILPENHLWDFDEKKTIPSRRGNCISELVSKHDCSPSLARNVEHGREALDALTRILSEEKRFFEIFQFRNRANWNSAIESVRQIFKWIIFRNNRTMKGSFLQYYADFEEELRDVFEPSFRNNRRKFAKIEGLGSQVVSLAKDDPELKIGKQGIMKILDAVDESQLQVFQSHFSLGLVPKICKHLRGEVGSRSELDDGEKSILKLQLETVEGVVERLANCRNKLMHGVVQNLFQLDEKKQHYVWEDFVSSYVDYAFVVRPLLSDMENFLISS